MKRFLQRSLWQRMPHGQSITIRNTRTTTCPIIENGLIAITWKWRLASRSAKACRADNCADCFWIYLFPLHGWRTLYQLTCLNTNTILQIQKSTSSGHWGYIVGCKTVQYLHVFEEHATDNAFMVASFDWPVSTVGKMWLLFSHVFFLSRDGEMCVKQNTLVSYSC